MKRLVLSALLSSVFAFPSHAGFTFSSKSYESGVIVRWVGVADFNEDGNPDLVISEPDSSRLVFLLGNGDGTFASRRVLSFSNVKLHGLVQTPLLAGAAGDLNGDGHADLVFTTSSGIVVLLGRGDATFPTIQTYPLLSPPSALLAEPLSLHIADLDGDGKPDLIFPDGGYELHVLWQGSQGTFGPESTYATTGHGPDDVALGDFNHDGLLDVATSDRGWVNYGWYVSVYLNHGNRALGPGTTYGAAYGPMSIFATDLYRNGSLDLITAGSQGIFSLLVNDGHGNFEYGPPFLGSDVSGLFQAALADLDQDGHPDLAIPTGSLVLEQGQEDGQFAIVDSLDISTNQWMVATADLNRDSRPDVLTWYYGVTVFLNQTPIVAAPTPRFQMSFEAPRPNPARHEVTFEFSLPEATPARLSIFDLSGRLVRTIATADQAAGPHRVVWDLRARTGSRAGAGVYFARLNAGTHELVRRVEVLP